MILKNKIIIYSVNTNSYDKYIFNQNLKKIFDGDLEIKYYIFTDKFINSNSVKFIEQIYIEQISKTKYKLKNKYQSNLIEIPEGITIDRFIKLNPIKVLPKHDLSIYHDARVSLFTNFIGEIKNFNNDFDLLSMEHRYRKSFTEENLINFANQRITFKQFIEITKYSLEINFNNSEQYFNSLSENGLIIRKSNNKINLLSQKWTKITVITGRDQPSLLLSLFELKSLNIKRKFLCNFSESKICRLNSRTNKISVFNKIINISYYILRYIYILFINILLKIIV